MPHRLLAITVGLALTLIVGVTSFVALVGFATGGLACVIVGGPAITLAVWLVSRRRPQPGRCAGCNYDLTGNVSGVCPECGRKV